MKIRFRVISTLLFSFFTAINVYASNYEEPMGGPMEERKEKEGKRGRKEQQQVQPTYKSLKETLEAHLQDNPELFNSSKGKDIVAVLGKTGAGKSTLINYLSGKKLKTEKTSLKGLIITNDPEDKSAMVIGSGKNSQTRLPRFVDVGDLRFYDLPGLDDTGGGPYELLNACFITHIIENAGTTRLVIVAGLDEVTASRGKSFKDLADRVASLLPAPIKISVCSSLVVTKTPGVADLEGSLLEEVDKQYLSPWIGASKPRISQMSKPQGNEINLDERKSIMKVIRDTDSVPISKINIGVLYSHEVSSVLRKTIKKEMLLSLDKLVRTVNAQTEDEASLGRIDVAEPVFWGQLKDEIASSKFIVLLKPFLAENDYKEVLSSLGGAVENQRVAIEGKIRMKKTDNEAKRLKSLEKEARSDRNTAIICALFVVPAPVAIPVALGFEIRRRGYAEACKRATDRMCDGAMDMINLLLPSSSSSSSCSYSDASSSLPSSYSLSSLSSSSNSSLSSSSSSSSS